MVLRLPCWEQPQPDSKAASEVMDTRKGSALATALLGFIAISAVLMSTTRASRFTAFFGHELTLTSSRQGWYFSETECR